jgi:hypothetical protein
MCTWPATPTPPTSLTSPAPSRRSSPNGRRRVCFPLQPALTIRLQSTYLGGNGADYVRALAIHPTTGEVYVTGSTSSTDFPKVPAPSSRRRVQAPMRSSPGWTRR